MTAANDFEDQRRHLRRIAIVKLSGTPCFMQITFIAFSQHCEASFFSSQNLKKQSLTIFFSFSHTLKGRDSEAALGL